MRALKLLRNYIPWFVFALIIGIGYMFLLLKPHQTIDSDFGFIQEVFLGYGTVGIGALIGVFIALLFILIDRKIIKTQQLSRTSIITKRVLLIVLVVTIVIALHYILEKWLDLI